MKGSGVAGLALWFTAVAATAAAHPVPFSYLDVRVHDRVLDVTLVAHVFDLAHDLGIEPSERLMDPAVLQAQAPRIAALVAGRLRLDADGQVVTNSTSWTAPAAIPDRQSVRLEARYQLARSPGRVTVTANLFPYDGEHQTFVNFYERDAIATQVILDHKRDRFEYFSGSRQGTFAVVRRFIPSGIHHILIGPDHLLFLVGLLLLGGSWRQLFLVVTAFTLAHSITLSLAALNILTPPARVIEPAIALSIVYVGVDNLLVREGRDMRAWIALAFGLIHGFGFANVLREMDLPRRALGWSLFSFNVGVEIGQMFAVVAIASAIAALRVRSERAGHLLAVAGSVVVMAAGAFWFIQRVFFPGGIS